MFLIHIFQNALKAGIQTNGDKVNALKVGAQINAEKILSNAEGILANTNVDTTLVSFNKHTYPRCTYKHL